LVLHTLSRYKKHLGGIYTRWCINWATEERSLETGLAFLGTAVVGFQRYRNAAALVQVQCEKQNTINKMMIVIMVKLGVGLVPRIHPYHTKKEFR
jgi:hypothetical protein